MPKCKFCNQNMNFYVYVEEGIAHFLYFCPKLLEGITKILETESTRYGSRYIYCRQIEVNRKRLSLKQSEIGRKCWYCGKRLWTLAKPGGKIDVMYICPGVLDFIWIAFEQEQKPKKLEWKLYCQFTERARELIGKK